MTFRFAALAFAATLLSPQAYAADYSQDGVFVLEEIGQPAGADAQARLQLKCALTFFINHKNGAFEQFFLDKDKFLKSGEVSYFEDRAGSCSMDDATKLESCKSNYALDGKITDEGASYNFYKELTPQRMSATTFGSPDDFTKWKAAGSPANDGAWAQTLCKDITTGTLKGHLSQEINPLGEDETTKRIFNNDTPKDEDYELARKVMAALKK